jgi:hypothetical protein
VTANPEGECGHTLCGIGGGWLVCTKPEGHNGRHADTEGATWTLRETATELVALRAEVERLRRLADASIVGMMLKATQVALAEERARVARVEAVRQRLLDPRETVTEGPLIGRIKVENWLRAALAAPEATE